MECVNEHAVPDGAAFCGECGVVVPRCLNGHPLEAGQAYCPACGAAVAVTARPTVTAGPWLRVVVGVVMLGVLVAGVALVWRSRSGSAASSLAAVDLTRQLPGCQPETVLSATQAAPGGTQRICWMTTASTPGASVVTVTDFAAEPVLADQVAKFLAQAKALKVPSCSYVVGETWLAWSFDAGQMRQVSQVAGAPVQDCSAPAA